MSRRGNTNCWAAFLSHIAPLIPDRADVFDIGPGLPRRSRLRRYCRHRHHAYFWGDIRGLCRGDPGFCEMRHESWVDVEDSRFDVVVSTDMLHNCERPWRLVPELVRICKPGGIVAVVTTMYECMNRHPVDCGRIWPDGLRVLLNDAGLTIDKLVIVSGLDGGLGQKNTIGNVEAAELVGIGRKPT